MFQLGRIEVRRFWFMVLLFLFSLGCLAEENVPRANREVFAKVGRPLPVYAINSIRQVSAYFDLNDIFNSTIQISVQGTYEGGGAGNILGAQFKVPQPFVREKYHTPWVVNLIGVSTFTDNQIPPGLGMGTSSGAGKIMDFSLLLHLQTDMWDRGQVERYWDIQIPVQGSEKPFQFSVILNKETGWKLVQQ